MIISMKYGNTSISGPTGPEMLVFWKAFQKLRADGQTERHFMYTDLQKYGEQCGPVNGR